MKNNIRVLAAVLCAVMLLIPFTACKSTPATPKVKTSISIYSDTEQKEPFMLIKDLELDEGSTVTAAMDALCAKYEASYTLGSDDQFLTFTYDNSTIKAPDGKQLDNGNMIMYFFGWTYNGEAMTSTADKAVTVKPAEKVVEDGSSIVVFVQALEVTPAEN